MKLNRSDVTAFLALIVSLGALSVSIVEANIMRAQQKIMQSQQKAAGYPHLSQHIDLGLPGPNPYTYTIENKGIGPAKIRKAEFRLNGQIMANNTELLAAIKKLFPPKAGVLVSFFDPTSYFISPKETITILKLTILHPEELAGEMPIIDLLTDFCYCSIFEDCWAQNGELSVDGCP